MQRIEGEFLISSDLPALPRRNFFALHDLVGANTFMLQLMKENAHKLGITASDAHFDSTIAATFNMLQNKTLNMDLSLENVADDTAYFSVNLENKAGHKFPSGYPSRRAFVQFFVLDENGDTLFKSGALTSEYEVEGHDAVFEPHYDSISQSDQVQIYEIQRVMFVCQA